MGNVLLQNKKQANQYCISKGPSYFANLSDLLDDLDFFKQRNIGVINASPLALGLLNNAATYPDWHIAPKIVKDACKKAADVCKNNNEDLGKQIIGFDYKGKIMDRNN